MKQTTPQPPTLAGRKIVLIGGSSGIGLATAKAAAAQQAQVIIVSSNRQRIDAALAELPAGSEGYALDVTQEEAVKRLFEHIGPLDHLVYTAGENLQLQTLDELKLEDAQAFFNIRYWGALSAVKYATSFLSKEGSIVLTSGIAAHRPGKGWSLGAGICSAMEGFTRAMAVELAPIRVNAVSPGVVETNLWSNLPEADRTALYESVAATLPVKRIGQAEDIAQTYLYLMLQRYGTGQTVIVDGGTVLV